MGLPSRPSGLIGLSLCPGLPILDPVMKRTLIFLVVVSLCANGWLLWRNAHRHGVAATPEAAGAVASTKPSFVALPVAAFASAEPAALLDLLRTTGADEGSVRAMFEGVLRRRHAEKIAELRVERLRTSWWRLETPQQAGEDAVMKQMVTDPLLRLLGPDPLDVEAVASKYAFLSPERQRQLVQVDLDYADIMRTAVVGQTGAQTRAEAIEQRMVAEERRKDIYASLSPEERAEYDLRFSGSASMIAPRVTVMGATEAEYRKIKPVIDEFDVRAKALPRDGTFAAAHDALQKTVMAKLAEEIGYERAADFAWSGHDNIYGAISKAARASQLPSDTPRRVMDLIADTGHRAAAVHAQAGLSLDEKRRALVSMQQEAQTKFDHLLPRDVQQSLSAADLGWLKQLGEGRYVVPTTTLFGGGSGFRMILLENRVSAGPGFTPSPAHPSSK